MNGVFPVRLACLAGMLCLWVCGGAKASGAVELIDAEGMRGQLEEYRGEVVVLNLWATWCVPCIKEIPDLMTLESELDSRGMRLVAVSMDDPADLGAVEAFRARHFPEFRTWLRGEPDMDTLVSVVDFAWNGILPTTYLINREGQVARKIQGKWSLDEFRTAVETLLD